MEIGPVLYEAIHHAIGARRFMRRFAEQTIKAKSGNVVLDIGCGPGALLRYLDGATYIGIDHSEANIARARRAYGSRGRFICGDATSLARHQMPPIDIVVAYGLLHHVDDEAAKQTLRAATTSLKPGGRLITVDPCRHSEQSFIARWFVDADRGAHVRHPEHYAELCRSFFPNARMELRGQFPARNSVCVIQATRPSSP